MVFRSPKDSQVEFHNGLGNIIHQINIGGDLQRHKGYQSTQFPMKSSVKKGVIHRKKVNTARI